MHELSIAQNILEIVESNLPPPPAPAVRSVKVRVGELSGIDPESLDFCFSAITSETRLQGTLLDIERVPLRCSCRSCSNQFVPEEFNFLCPGCKGTNVEILSGRELQVVEIELEEVAAG